jgi:hypothetical protein
MENSKTRNAVLITLVEGDILVNDGVYKHVSEGEVTIYADKTIDESNGELIEISIEGIQSALAEGNQIVNLEELD